MKHILITVFVVVLTGCNHNPIKTSFPNLPDELMKTPIALKTMQTQEQDDAINPAVGEISSIKLSELTKTVTDNYKTCNAYREQIFGLQDWLLSQKKLNP